MGGNGSGRKRKIEITDGVKNLIKMARSFNIRWIDISKALGQSDCKFLLDFRHNNPEFEAECEMAFLTRKLNFASRLEKAALPAEGGANTTLAVKFAEQFGIFEKDVKGPLAAFQVNNNGEGGAGIQVCFVDAPPRELPMPETIDA